MTRDLLAYDTATPTSPAARLQYVLRFDTAGDTDYFAMDVDAVGNLSFHGGTLTAADALPPTNPQPPGLASGTAEGAEYDHASSVGPAPIAGHIDGNSITFTVPAAELGISATSPIYSATAFAMAGPLAAAQAVQNPMRTIDATPPFDGVSNN
jgi:hypothetical protein